MTPAIPEPVSVFPDLAGTRRFTTDEYHRLIDAGLLGPDDHVELLDGYILYKADYPELTPADGPFPEWRWLRRWTSAEYHRMIDLSIIGEVEKVELLGGYVVVKMPQNIPHRASLLRLTTLLPARLPAGWLLASQCPCSIAGMDPEPDVIVVRGGVADYDDRVPTPADFGIAVEVSDSSLKLDRRGKGRLYATAGIPVYWIVNVVDRQVEVYTDPDPTATPPAYQARADYRPGQDVPVVLDGVAVAAVPAADLLP